MANLPRDYPAARDRLRELSDIFQDELAAAFQPLLQAELASMPSATYDDKRTIVIWANGETRHLGLAFRTENGAPAHLIADYTMKGRGRDGRFRFDIGYQAGGNRRTGVYYELPPIELMDEGPRHEPLAKWTDRVSRQDAERQR